MVAYDVLVLFGGVSNENEISVITGTMACNVLKRGGKSVLPVYISQQGDMYAAESLADINAFRHGGYLSAPKAAVCRGGAIIFGRRGRIKQRCRVLCALNCCHGGDGEGGGAYGLFSMNGIPCASAGLFESSLFMDKYLTKIALVGLGVTCAPYVYLKEGSRIPDGVVYPVIVKPCKLGSSIGVVKADDVEQLSKALEAAFELDDAVIVEQYFSDRREINCAAYMAEGRVKVSECEEALSDGDLLSYDDKYSGGGKRVFPAEIEEEQSQFIKSQTAHVYSSLNMRGIVRFDYIISGGTIYLSEVNTVPGSLSYYLLSSGFADFYNVLEGVIKQASYDFAKAEKKLLVNTGIINNFASNACKMK